MKRCISKVVGQIHTRTKRQELNCTFEVISSTGTVQWCSTIFVRVINNLRTPVLCDFQVLNVDWIKDGDVKIPLCQTLRGRSFYKAR